MFEKSYQKNVIQDTKDSLIFFYEKLPNYLSKNQSIYQCLNYFL